MKNILILTGRYLPGYKDGGPVRTIKNLTDMYGDDYHFTIACADRDHGDTKPYENVKTGVNNTNHVGKADVVYICEGKFKFKDIKTLSSKNELVYVCGPYNSYAIKALILNKLGKIKCPFVLAPMGSFSKGALALKSRKKKLFLSVFKIFGLFKNIYFSVTSEVEERELKEALHLNNKCYIAEDPQRLPGEKRSRNIMEDGVLKVVFLSRISEKKNLLYAARILKGVKNKIVFHIYGIMEDTKYYERCEEELKKLPENISWKYMGEADSEKVPQILSEYDVFLFPTLGENFGHVISEALSSGTIQVISDTTPWLDLEEKNAGYVLSLNDEKSFTECIDKMCEMSADELNKISENAVDYYIDKYNESVKKSGYISIFSELIK